MSSTYHMKSMHIEANHVVDKENAFISSNLSQEKRYSATRKYRKANDFLLKPSLAQYGQEPLSYQQPNLPQSFLLKGHHDQELAKKISSSRVKKSLNFERSSFNGKLESLINAKERQQFVEKENKHSAVEQRERFSSIEGGRHSLKEQKKNVVVNETKVPYAEKEPIKLNPVLEPIAKEDKQENDLIPEKPCLSDSESEKKVKEVVDFTEQCNETLRDYVADIMGTLKMKDKESTPIYPLKKHKIPLNLRAKMIDWMVEVLSSYKCSDQTFFVAVNIMDLFFQKTKVVHEVSDLHLTGVTCMFMASKYEEIYPLRLNVVHEKIAHRKLQPEQIKKKEMEIFATLDYKMTNSTPYEFMMNTLHQLDLKSIMSPKLFEYLKRVCIYLAKANMHDYELVNQQDYSELAASTLFVAFKIIEQLDKNFPLSQMLNKIREILSVEEDIVYDCATRILSVAKNFDKLYPNLDNLKKFHSFNFDDISTQKNNENSKGSKPSTNH